MANLLSLPFDVQLLIVRQLDLKDCLSYSQLSTTSHDVVYYVFSHRAELDFSSVLSDDQYVLLSDSLLKSFMLTLELLLYEISVSLDHLQHFLILLIIWTSTRD